MKVPSRPVLIFLFVFCAAMAFALFTRHAWEDYWITFRTSRNLAEGHGLVFNPGDRLHTFTSPLGVLLPALAYAMTGNSSDYGALWIFRLMSAAALGGAAVLLYHAARRVQFGRPAVAALILFLATDSKTLDFTINGMETAFLLLFFAWTFYALLARPARPWLHLGLAWGGLMWTRPDSFIYIGVLAAGVWLFNERGRTGLGRFDWVKLFFRAGLVTTAIYLPWLLFATAYYGTPVPHTVTAKSMNDIPVTLGRLSQFFRTLPAETWQPNNSFAATFLPSYYMLGGWPAWIPKAAALLAGAISLVWLLPFVRWWARAASLTFLAGHIYLSLVPFFPFPWYLPTTTLLAGVVLATLLQQAHEAIGRRGPALAGLLAGGVAAFVLTATWLTLGTARQDAAGQRIVEDGNRKQIGLYLREHANPHDTVFMEPLGYIGYFSRLKTYDFPGLSSREVTEARKRVGGVWSSLVNYLQPNWLVLRDDEIRTMNTNDSSILGYRYEKERAFDVSDAVAKLDVPGRDYLKFDSRFTLFRKQSLPFFDTPYGPARNFFKIFQPGQIDGTDVMVLHAPSELMLDVPAGAKEVYLQFGYIADAYLYGEPGQQTDGARFSAQWGGSTSNILMWTRELKPVTEPADRGLQSITLKLRAGPYPRKMILRIGTGETMTRDWTAWAKPVFR